MANKYKTGSGEFCAVKYCSNSRKRLFVWDNSECDEHVGILHKDCACLRPFKLHKCPKDEEKRREWIKALNRKELPKNIRVCSEHFIDGKPTPRNPAPKLNLGYDTPDVKEGRKPPTKRQAKKRKIDYDLSDEEIPSHEDNEPPGECNPLPQDIDSPNVIRTEKPIMVNASTQYEDFTIQDHVYSRLSSLCNSSTKHVQTDSTMMTSKAVHCNLDAEESVAKREIRTDTDALFMVSVTFTALPFGSRKPPHHPLSQALSMAFMATDYGAT
jgi:hypothetical protein